MSREYDVGYDKGPIWARRVWIDTFPFSKNLSALDDDLQKALETIDQMDLGPTSHGDLSDMPDTLGTNTDHDVRNDARLVKLDQTTPQYIENGSPVSLAEPTFTYTAGVLTRIDYVSGYYKEFSYNVDGTLDELDYNGVKTKKFTYTAGLLTGITIL